MNISLDIIQSISDFLNSGFMDILKNFLAIIPKILYFIIACIMSLIDLFQVMFRKLAGLDQIIISGEVTTGDSIYQIIMDALFTGKYPAINTAFWSILILGVFMLIVTCIIATIRLEYNPDKDKGNSKGAIVKNFFKALFSFAIVPIACIFGMAISNSLIGVIDQVTTVEVEQTDNVYNYYDQWTGISGTSESNILMENKASYIAYDIFGITVPTTAEPFSGMVFKASAYSCNRFRLYGSSYLAEVNASGTDLGIFSTGQVGDYETAAQIVDTGFAINAKLKGGSYSLDYSDAIKERYKQSLALFGSKNNITNFSKYNVEMVWYFYDLWTFNYIVGFAAVIIIGKLYFQFCLVLMARLFEIAGLFLVAPIPIAIMPMDGGGAMARWRGSFVGKFGLIVIMVFGLNIISPVLSIIQEVKLFGLPLLDNIVLAMFLVAALNAVNSLNNTFSSIIFDKASAYKDSMDLAKDAQGNIQAGLQATMSAGKVATFVPALGAKMAGRGVAWGAKKGFNAGMNAIHKKQDKVYQSKKEQLGASHTRKDDSYHAQERDAIKDSIKYDATVGEANFDAMTSADRRKMNDDLFATRYGQEFADKYYGGNIEEAKKRIAEDGKPGTKKSNYLSAEAKAEIAQFEHDRKQFARTKEAAGLEEGSAAYRRALEKYASGSEDAKAEYFVGDKALNDTQAKIQEKRAEALSDYKREMRKLEDEQSTRIKRREGFKAGMSGVAKNVGKFNENFLKPAVGRAGEGVQSLINLIPGMEIFRKKGK